MPTAPAIGGDKRSHPESGQPAMCLTLDWPYAVGGEVADTTWLWAEPACPAPALDEPVTWDHRHVILRGVTYRKIENDSNPDALWL